MVFLFFFFFIFQVVQIQEICHISIAWGSKMAYSPINMLWLWSHRYPKCIIHEDDDAYTQLPSVELHIFIERPVESWGVELHILINGVTNWIKCVWLRD